MSIFSADSVGSLLGSALDGLSARQTVIADNIANIDTPGFTARNIEFEGSLQAAVRDGEFNAGDLRITTSDTDTPAGLNGNNVDLRKEVMASQQTTFQYQILSRAAGDRFEVLRTATRTQ